MDALQESGHYLLQAGAWVLELVACYDINANCWVLDEVNGRLRILVKPDGKLIPEIADASLEPFARQIEAANFTTNELTRKDVAA